jgi:hypothetical protein
VLRDGFDDRTGFYNVLTTEVPDIAWFLDKLADHTAEEEGYCSR